MHGTQRAAGVHRAKGNRHQTNDNSLIGLKNHKLPDRFGQLRLLSAAAIAYEVGATFLEDYW